MIINMATAVNGVRLAARTCSGRPTAHQYTTKTIGLDRAFTTTSIRLKRTRARHVAAKLEKSDDPLAGEVLALSKELEELGKGRSDPAWDRIKQRTRNKFLPLALPERPGKPKNTFMNVGDPDPWEYEDTLEDDDDDINSLGHIELEQHREVRHYARLAAWELPLLSSE